MASNFAKKSYPLQRLFWLTVACIHPLFFLQLYFAGNWYSITHDYSLGMICGITSYCYMNTVLLLSTRIRYFDKLFGQDRIMKFHGHFASIAILLGAIHLFFKREYIAEVTLQTVLGAGALLISGILATMTVLFMVEKVIVPIPKLQTIKKSIKKYVNIDYSLMKNLHNGFSLALCFLIIHALLASSTAETLLRTISMGILGGVSVLRYLFHIIAKPHLLQKRAYTITEVKNLSEDIVELTFSPRGNKISFKAGQFAYIKIFSPHISSEEHPFTISSSPTGENISMTIKNLGDYTAKLPQVEIGSSVLIDGPYGTFTPHNNQRDKLFIAGGIGITPFLSLLQEWKEKEVTNNVTLLWSVRHEEELIQLELLQNIASQNSWFTFQIFVTQQAETTFTYGRINRGIVQPFLKREIYICGPELLTEALLKIFHEEKVPKKEIHFEDFSF